MGWGGEEGGWTLQSYKGVIISLVSWPSTTVSHEAEMQFVTFGVMNELSGKVLIQDSSALK